MATRILEDSDTDRAVLYCSTTMWAFGPVIYSFKHLDASEVAGRFVQYVAKVYGCDIRKLSSSEQDEAYHEFLGLLKVDPPSEDDDD